MMRVLTVVMLALATGSAQRAFLSVDEVGGAPAPAGAGAPGAPGPAGKYDLEAFKTEWHTEWRHGDFPDYKETHTDTWQFNPAQKWEDSQSDQKPSEAKWH